MLTSITIRRFKSLSSTTIELADVTVLVGPNNGGKSSIQQAIQFAVSVAQTSMLTTGRTTPRDGSLPTDRLLYTPLRDVHRLAQGGSLSRDRKSEIVVEFTENLGEAATVRVRRGNNKNISASFEGSSRIIRELASIARPYSIIAPGLAGIPAWEEFRSAAIVRRAAARGDANSVLRNVLWILRQEPEAWTLFTERLQEIFPEAQAEVTFDPDSDDHISATITRAGLRLPIDASGTGVLQAAQILAYIGAYKPRLLILDEPDSHLHPDNQRALARLLQRVSEEERTRVLLSTHSRHLFDECVSLGAQSHWVASGGVIKSDPKRVDVLLGLGALDIAERIASDKTPVIILTEDEDKKYIRALMLSSGYTEKQFSCISYRGCTNLAATQALADFILDSAPSTKIVVHRDRDALDDASVEKIRTQSKQHGVEVFITSGTDIESEFLTAAHVALALEGDVGLAQDLIDRATSEARAASIRKVIDQRSLEALATKQASGETWSPGELAQIVAEEYDSDPERYRHGKEVLKVLNKLIQQNSKHQGTLAFASPALHNAELASFAPTTLAESVV